MPSTEQIEQAAQDLGKMLADHEAAKAFESATTAFNADTEAQRAVNDFSRHLQSVQEKQMQGQPIEVADKKKLEELQTQVALNLHVQQLQQAQVAYTDLLRKVTQIIAEQSGGVSPEGAAGGSPIL